ncbi:MAG: hypothetical protein ABIG61_15230 [Planctomycetota bacterium]
MYWLIRNLEFRNMLIVSLCLILLPIGVLKAQSEDALTPEILLRKAQGNFNSCLPLAFDSEVITTYPDQKGKSGEITKRRYISSFRQDGDRVDLFTLRLETSDGKEVPVIESRAIWDGSLFINRTKLKEAGASDVAYFSHDKSLKSILVKYDSESSFLDGLFPGGTEHFTSTMLSSSNLTLKSEMENVSGSPCYVVEAVGKYGYYKVWIDPGCNYNYRKALIRQEIGDIHTDGQPLSNEGTKALKFVVDNVKLDNIDGVWFPVAGTAERYQVYKDKEYHYQYLASRSNIIWNPDFDKMGAFQMDLPEGAYIRNDEVPGIPYEWRDGRIIPYIDDLVIESIKKDVDQLLASEKTPGIKSNKNIISSGQKEGEVKELMTPQKTVISKKPLETSGVTEKKFPESYSFIWVIVIIAVVVVLSGWWLLFLSKK